MVEKYSLACIIVVCVIIINLTYVSRQYKHVDFNEMTYGDLSSQGNSLYQPYHLKLISPEFEPTRCRDPVWRPSGLDSNYNNASGTLDNPAAPPSTTSKTFVLVVPHWSRHIDSMKYIGNTISMIRTYSHIPISVLISGAKPMEVNRLGNMLSTFGYNNVTFKIVKNPVNASLLPLSFIREQNGETAGIDDYVLLHAFGLPYDKALVLSFDVDLHKGIDHLFDCDDVDVMYTGAPDSPLRDGVLVIPANSPSTVTDMVSKLYEVAPTYTKANCFDSLGCDYASVTSTTGTGGTTGGTPAAVAIKHAYANQAGPQGFLYYYFVKQFQKSKSITSSPSSISTSIKKQLRVVRISACLYNNRNLTSDHCRGELLRYHGLGVGSGISPYVVGSEPPVQKLRTTSRPVHAVVLKPCVADFWITGARKAGTTALYLWLTEHPDIERLHMRRTPHSHGGEVLLQVTPKSLKLYNRAFTTNRSFVEMPQAQSPAIDAPATPDAASITSASIPVPVAVSRRITEAELSPFVAAGRNYNSNNNNAHRGRQQQLSHLSLLPHYLMSGDASSVRLRRDAANIANTCGHSDVKYFALLRDPIERLFSSAMVRINAMKKDDAVKELNVSAMILKDLKEFKQMEKKRPNWFRMKKQGKFKHLFETNNGKVPRKANDQSEYTMNMFYDGLYFAFLREWFHVSGVDNIRIYFTEDFIANKEGTVRNALQHLGLDDSKWQPSAESLARLVVPEFVGPASSSATSIPLSSSSNSSSISGSISSSSSSSSSSAVDYRYNLSPQLVSALRHSYAPYNTLLSALLNRTLPWGY